MEEVLVAISTNLEKLGIKGCGSGVFTRRQKERVRHKAEPRKCGNIGTRPPGFGNVFVVIFVDYRAFS